MKRTTILIDEQDRHAAKVIQQRYGLSSLTAAIRVSLRIVSTSRNMHDIEKHLTNVYNYDILYSDKREGDNEP